MCGIHTQASQTFFIGFILKLRVEEHLGLFMLGGPEVKPISGVTGIKYDPSPLNGIKKLRKTSLTLRLIFNYTEG